MIRRLRFLAPVTVTTLSLSRVIAPFGVGGGEPGAPGENTAEWPDGRRKALSGNAEVDLPAGGVFEMHTPGGGGWGHPADRPADGRVETAPGLVCEVRYQALDPVGLYIPGGSAPLVSTVMMLAIPASLAGCKNIVMCSPPGPDGRIADEVLAAARLCGVTRVFVAGGAQAMVSSIPSGSKIRWRRNSPSSGTVRTCGSSLDLRRDAGEPSTPICVKTCSPSSKLPLADGITNDLPEVGPGRDDGIEGVAHLLGARSRSGSINASISSGVRPGGRVRGGGYRFP